MANDHKDIWEQEHTRQNTFTVMHTMRPAKPLPPFVDLLKNHGLIPSQTTILDVGCGKGRNSIYLASLGFQVIAVDFSEKAIGDARVRSRMYAGNIRYEVVDLALDWPYNNNEIDAIIDLNTTIYMPEAHRAVAIAEAHRVLKPGGYYLFYGLADHLTNAVSYHNQNYVEKHYTLEELTKEYAAFTPVSIEPMTTNDKVEGKDVEKQMWVGIFQK